MSKGCIGTMFVSPTLHQILSQRIDSIRSMARCGKSVLGRAHTPLSCICETLRN